MPSSKRLPRKASRRSRASSKRHGAEVAATLEEATLEAPAEVKHVSTGKHGEHSERMGYLLAEMQSLARQHPGATW